MILISPWLDITLKNEKIPEKEEDKINHPFICHTTISTVDAFISNAFYYGKTVAVVLESNNSKMEIKVDDDGPGIPEDKREEVFKAFYRIEGSRNKETGGVGLGLSIARDIIVSHGGTIELGQSDMGGLRVLISIPL